MDCPPPNSASYFCPALCDAAMLEHHAIYEPRHAARISSAPISRFQCPNFLPRIRHNVGHYSHLSVSEIVSHVRKPGIIFILTILLTMQATMKGSSQPTTDISVAGGEGTQRIVVLPRRGQDPIVLSLQGSLSWKNSLGSSAGFFKYKWGVLDENGNFLPSGSESSARVVMRRTDSEMSTDVSVDRSVLFIPDRAKAGSNNDLLVAIRIEECAFDPPNTDFQARCMFTGTVSAQQDR